MRDAFVRSLYKQFKINPSIYLLVADLGIFIFDDFKKSFPKRFINIGVAEANMIGMASGLALCGKIPFVYSIVPFVTARCFEQIRIDACYQNLPVKIIGVGGGFAYASLGPTHHAIEDISIMRSLPNMTVISPADTYETEKAVEAIVKIKGPVYLRLVKSGEPKVHTKNYDFTVGKAVKLRDGKDVTIISTGGLVYNCLKACEILEEVGIKARLLNFHTIKPIDKESIFDAAANTKAIITVEEHSIIGGLGSAVAEVLAENSDIHVPFRREGINDTFCKEFGSHSYLQQIHGFSVSDIVKKAKRFLASI
ncbi:MAG: transketolase [Candidatus Omnitrophica bacterium]|nr:transketolase [Candidatus Omnitrophota bacterium]